jgi:hypothetical protein
MFEITFVMCIVYLKMKSEILEFYLAPQKYYFIFGEMFF